MKTKFAKAIAANITVIAGNVAHVALIDARIIPNDECHPPSRADAVRKIQQCEANIVDLLKSPGAMQKD